MPGVPDQEEGWVTHTPRAPRNGFADSATVELAAACVQVLISVLMGTLIPLLIDGRGLRVSNVSRQLTEIDVADMGWLGSEWLMGPKRTTVRLGPGIAASVSPVLLLVLTLVWLGVAAPASTVVSLLNGYAIFGFFRMVANLWTYYPLLGDRRAWFLRARASSRAYVPSGHTFTVAYLVVFMLLVGTEEGSAARLAGHVIVALFLLVVGACISFSRIHHTLDVVLGAAFGYLLAYVCAEVVVTWKPTLAVHVLFWLSLALNLVVFAPGSRYGHKVPGVGPI